MDDFENEQILTKKSVQLHNDIDSLISKLESLVEAVDIASKTNKRLHSNYHHENQFDYK